MKKYSKYKKVNMCLRCTQEQQKSDRKSTAVLISCAKKGVQQASADQWVTHTDTGAIVLTSVIAYFMGKM